MQWLCMAKLSVHVMVIFDSLIVSISTTAIILKCAKFCSMDTRELHGDTLQPGGQLETPGLVSF